MNVLLTLPLDIKQDKIETLSVPMYNNLSIEEILTFAQGYDQVADYMPEERDMKKITRQFVIDIVNTVV